jgi:DNA-binding NarL/FixJ family response regulator
MGPRAAADHPWSGAMPPVTVLLVDDDPPFRRIAAELLAGRGFEVVAQAGDGERALAECARVLPEAALVDVHLPDTDGFALARALARCESRPRVLLTSTDAGVATAAAVAESGAVGFVPKAELAVTDLAPYFAG